MKTIVTATVIALGMGLPAVAQSVDTLTLGQRVELQLKQSEDSAGERAVYFGNERINFSASNIHNDKAAEIFERLRAESLENE